MLSLHLVVEKSCLSYLALTFRLFAFEIILNNTKKLKKTVLLLSHFMIKIHYQTCLDLCILINYLYFSLIIFILKNLSENMPFILN